MKIKLISIILTLILCLSTVSLLVSCGGTTGASAQTKPSSSESESSSGEEETLPPPIEVADGSYLSYVLMSDEKSYAVWGLISESGAKKIIIPEEYRGLPVTAISEDAFASMEPLTTIVIPDTVTHIGARAFDGCSNLKNLDLSANLQYVGEGAFDGCDSLPLTTYENALYIGDSDNPYSILVSATDTEIESCTVHEDTRIIYDGAFFDCTEVDDVFIPSTVLQVGYAFYGCMDLFPNNSVGGAFYLGNEDNPYLILVSALSNITSIEIQEGTEIIAPFAFEGCSSLASVTIPESVRFIGNYAFAECSALSEVNIQGSSWRVINGSRISTLVEVGTEESNFIGRLVDIYSYCTWVKK